MTRRRANLSLARDAADHLDVQATRRCVSRNVYAEALVRADMAGDVQNLDAHVEAVDATIRAEATERGKQLAPIGRSVPHRPAGGRPRGTGGTPVTCSRCGGTGHNARTCKH